MAAMVLQVPASHFINPSSLGKAFTEEQECLRVYYFLPHRIACPCTSHLFYVTVSELS